MSSDNNFDTGFFNNRKMDVCFRRIFIKKRTFCSPETGKPEVTKIPSFILIDGGIMVLHQEAFQEELKSAWEKYQRELGPGHS